MKAKELKEALKSVSDERDIVITSEEGVGAVVHAVELAQGQVWFHVRGREDEAICIIVAKDQAPHLGLRAQRHDAALLDYIYSNESNPAVQRLLKAVGKIRDY